MYTVNCVTDLEELDEEDMLMRAIAMSLEEEKGVAEEELFFAKGIAPERSIFYRLTDFTNLNFSGDSKNKMLASITPHGVEDEEELLKMAIAMSLDEQ